ncbi:hypothetical protein GWK48_00530 [Metallosphaera tengchongensis]|uniref:Uncharacterized protein n=1 Tax=Metallosphaera tengchongensis TaxID=1532350 RepID=A0A6N0NQW5_9CREN|nr:hypothetical protein [Metallosphaera tengchongensis]QKQ99081.1 hypothetical protein GWK48_00530 [Metallosphaera tengchongensis]
MKGQSEFITFLIAVILIIVVIIPLFLFMINVSEPSVKSLDTTSVLQRQINGGSILLFYNASPSKPELLVLRGGGNYTLDAVYFLGKGPWVNISSSVRPIQSAQQHIPLPLTYNFSLPEYVWNETILVQISGYNVSVFATLLPNETAFS